MQKSKTPMARPMVERVGLGEDGLELVVMAAVPKLSVERERPSVETGAMPGRDKLPRGGHGGSAEVRGNRGAAIGGRGGRGGNVPGAVGGDGGGGVHEGEGASIGGDGGDAGRFGRPTLGAPSTLERLRDTDWFGIVLANSVDEYGILIPGRGGDGGEATIVSDGRLYSLNVLLKLLRIWRNEIIDVVDELAPRSPQEWWDLAVQTFPKECDRALTHMRECEDHTDLTARSPYF
jgi:hypothetical protein